MQFSVFTLLKKSFFPGVHLEKDFFRKRCDSNLQYAGIHFVFSVYLDLENRGFDAGIRNYGMSLHGNL